MDRLARNEPGALEAFVQRHSAVVTRLAHRLLGWRGDVDDVVQDVFLAAWTSARRFDGRSSVSTWLVAITINQCRKSIRRETRRRMWQRLGFGGSHAPAADAASLSDEVTTAVRSAIAQLSPADREVVVLHHLQGLTADEIAAIVGASRGAVEVRVHRARQRLKVILGEVKP